MNFRRTSNKESEQAMDPEDLMRKIDRLAEEFAESPSLALAEQLEKLLSKFKIAVGLGVFD